MNSIKELLDAELWDSAEILAQLLLSSSSSESTGHGLYEMLGDALYAKFQYSRAIANYHREMEHVDKTGEDSCLLNSLKLKECKCMIEMKENSSALRVLESIAFEDRSVQVNMTLGKLYRLGNLKRDAISSYRAVLSNNPYSVEAIVS